MQMCVNHTKTSFKHFFCFFAIKFKIINRICFWTNMIIPIVSFTSSIILITSKTSTRLSFRFCNTKIGIQIYKRWINGFSFNICSNGSIRNFYRFANCNNFTVFNKQSTVVNYFCWRYINCCICKSKRSIFGCFYPTVFWKILLSLCERKRQAKEQEK